MPAHHLHSSFVGGEVSRALGARVDWAKYAMACWRSENRDIMAEGGGYHRPGLRFVAEVKDSSKFVRLIPFEFSVEQAYVLEFGDQYMRVFKDQGQVVSGASPYEIVTPYTEAELPYLKFAQVADVMIIVSPDRPPHQLSRTGHTSWTIAEFANIDGPYCETSDATLTPSGLSGTITMTASASIFTADMVGAHLRWKADDAYWYWCVITSYTSATEVTVTVMGEAGKETGALPNTNASGPIRLGAWRTDLGYPAAVTFYEQRLIFARTVSQPQTWWGSAIDDYPNFRASMKREGRNWDGSTYYADMITDDDAIEYTLATEQVNGIQWIVPTRRLVLGTTGGEHAAGATDANSALTPLDIAVRRDTNMGSANAQGMLLDGAVIYIGRAGKNQYGKKLRQLEYRWEADRYVSPDLMRVASHLGKPGLVGFTVSTTPDPIVWVWRTDGVLLRLIYVPDENVVAWTRYITAGAFEWAATIPGDGRDETWVVVRRAINGATKRYIEFVENYLEDEDGGTVIDSFYVDSGLSYRGAPTTVVSNLGHLAGEEVAILADGIPRARQTVSAGGTITLPVAASVVHVGLPYEGYLQPTFIEFPMKDGQSLGRVRRINKTTLRFINSVGGLVGPDEDHLEPIEGFRPGDRGYGVATGMFTGDLDADYAGDFETCSAPLIVQRDPLPQKVLAIKSQVEVYG